MAYYERLNIKDIFQEEVFTDEVMQRYMSEDAYRALKTLSRAATNCRGVLPTKLPRQ